MSKQPRKLTAIAPIVLAAALAPAAVLFAHDSSQHSSSDLMKARHDHYHQLGDAFKAVRDASRGGSPDWDELERAAKIVNDGSVNQGRWFPAGTGPEAGETRALPEIWSKPGEFTAAQKKFSDAAPKLLAAVDARDVDRVRSQFAEVGRACKNCHDNFRSPEEHD